MAGEVAPAAMETVAGTIALVVSLLVSVTVTPPAGAGTGSTTLNGTEPPICTVEPAGRPTGPADVTVTPMLVWARFVLLACIVVEPKATLVMGTVAVVFVAVKVTVAGTVATPVLSELRFTVMPLAGAGPERFKVTFCVVKPEMVMVVGEKVMLPFTVMAVVADV